MLKLTERQLILYLLLLVVALILYGSFYPFRFELERFYELRVSLMFEYMQIRRSNYADIIGNLIFYIPLGMVLIHTFPKEWHPGIRVLITVILGAFMSFSIEYMQQMTTNRVSSFLDVILNSTSTALGAFLGLIFQIDAKNMPHILKENSSFALPFLLIGLWFTIHTIPFIPDIGIYKLTHRILDLLKMQYTINGIAGWLAGYFIVSLALRELIRDDLFWWAFILLAAFSLTARLTILNQHLSFNECLGLLGAFLLMICTIKIPFTKLAKPAFHLVWILLLIAALGPLTLTNDAQPFHWIPFTGFLEAGSEKGSISFAHKLFIYTGALWLAVEGGMKLKNAVIILLYVTALSEYLQRYLPNRTPEITELLMVLISALVVLAIQTSSKNNK